MQSSEDIANSCRLLAESIRSEEDARTRMQHCRRALGLGRSAVKQAEELSDSDLLDVQETLRLAHRESRGIYNPNTSITKLAKIRMDRAGLTALPIIRATRPKLVGTQTACLAVASSALPDDWFDLQSAIPQMNAGRYIASGVGADGSYSVCLRLIEASDHFLESTEYKKVVEVLPPAAIEVVSERVFFGAAEAIEGGAALRVANGRYTCSIASLRSGRNLRFIATLLRSDEAVPTIYQFPEMREV